MRERKTVAPKLDTQLFRDFFNANPIGIAIENLEGQPLFVNPAFCSFLGFTEEELRNKHCVDFSPREDAEKDWALFQKLRAGFIDHYQLQKRYFRKDGSLVWGTLSISLLRSHPSPLVIAMVEDITEQRRTQDDFQVVTKRAPAAIARCSRDLRYLWANEGYANWIKRPLDNVVGRPILDVLGREAFESLHRHFRRVLSGENVSYEEEVNFDGIGRRWISAAYTPTFDASGSANGWVSLVSDITEGRRTQELLSRLAGIVESSEDAIISKNLDGIITSWNAGAERIYGFTEAEVIGQPITILVPPDLLQEETQILKRVSEGGRVQHYETIRVTKAGTKVDVSLSISPLRNSTGRIVGFSKIARDISMRKRADQALAEMTRKLIEAQEQERARIGRELHDDINQRLAMLALELEQPHDPSEFQNRVRAFREELRRISDDVQALSHDLHSTKLEYLGVVAGMKSWCKEFAERQKMDVDFRSDVRNVLSLDIGRPLFRVLQEALYNAFKYAGVKHIEVLLREDSGEVHLIVRDSGKGFDVEAALQGKGLGLTSMRERVRLVNGTIAIESQPVSGTTIHVSVPLESKQVSAKTA